MLPFYALKPDLSIRFDVNSTGLYGLQRVLKFLTGQSASTLF